MTFNERSVFSKNIVFLGNALLDISAKCDQSLLEEYHLKADDNCEANDWQLPLFDRLLAMADALTTPGLATVHPDDNINHCRLTGGSAQNSARIAKQVLIEKMDSEETVPSVYFLGSIGTDKTGQLLEKYVREAKVEPLYYYHPTLPTGLTAGLVTSDVNRTLMANIGASKAMPEEFIESSVVREALNKSIINVCESYFLTHSPNTVFSLAKMSAHLKRSFFLSLSATYVVTEHFQKIMDLMPYTDAIFGNRSEALTFAKLLTGDQSSDIELTARVIASIPINRKSGGLWPNVKRCVFITQGSDPLIVAKYTASDEVIVRSYSVPTIQVKGDTIGAGDAFVGAVVAQLVCGLDIDEAVGLGIEIAGKVCQNRGCVLKSIL